MIRRLFNRLVCLVRGHAWKYYKTTQVTSIRHGWILIKCTRCGNVKEKWI